MKRDQEMYPGGAKKFLYDSGSSRKSAKSEENKWSFDGKKQTNSESRFDLDDVWSIKKNVALNKTRQKGDKLNLNVNTHFYSRHGGLKDRADTGSGMEASSSYVSGGGARSWTTGRRGFSYSTNQTPPTTGQRGVRNSASSNQDADDSPGLKDDTQPVNGFRYGHSSKNSDPFRF